MKKILHSRSLYVGIAILLVIVVLLMIKDVKSRNQQNLVTATISTGLVQQIVSVSGVAEAEQIAELAFSNGGIVKEVKVKVGDYVEIGDVIAELDSRSLAAERAEAVSLLQKAEADKMELITGPSASARNLTEETVISKKQKLTSTISDEEQKIKNAYTKLLTSDLTAYSNVANEGAKAPVISGTYNCEVEGEYILDVFSSNNDSGYSFKLSGLETGTYNASADQPTAFGDCGLRIIFDGTSNYSRSNWIIEIPNTKSSTYVANRNAYVLAKTEADSAIKAAEQAVSLAEAEADNQNSPARSEAVVRADAAIEQAKARLASLDANLSDRILKAPFSGTITEIDILPGETVGTEPIVTLLADSEFEVTAKIPEIDIGKLSLGQRVQMVFDAKSDESLTGLVTFISLKATEIDGVSYYEALIDFDAVPSWIRSGLNADIDIIIDEKQNTLRVPTRFISNLDNQDLVFVLNETNLTTSTSTIKIEMQGNDGFTAISGLTEGTIVVAP